MSRPNTLYDWFNCGTRVGVNSRKQDMTGAVADIETEQVGQKAAGCLQFIPHSVMQRRRGLVLHAWKHGKRWVRQWITPQQRERLIWREQKAILKSQEVYDASFNWFQEMEMEENVMDNQFVTMSQQDWETFKQRDILTWITRQQRANGLIFWDRIDRKRRAAKPTKVNYETGWTLEQDLEDEPWKYDEKEAWQCDMDWEPCTPRNNMEQDMEWEYTR